MWLYIVRAPVSMKTEQMLMAMITLKTPFSSIPTPLGNLPIVPRPVCNTDSDSTKVHSRTEEKMKLFEFLLWSVSFFQSTPQVIRSMYELNFSSIYIQSEYVSILTGRRLKPFQVLRDTVLNNVYIPYNSAIQFAIFFKSTFDQKH